MPRWRAAFIVRSPLPRSSSGPVFSSHRISTISTSVSRMHHRRYLTPSIMTIRSATSSRNDPHPDCARGCSPHAGAPGGAGRGRSFGGSVPWVAEDRTGSRSRQFGLCSGRRRAPPPLPPYSGPISGHCFAFPSSGMSDLHPREPLRRLEVDRRAASSFSSDAKASSGGAPFCHRPRFARTRCAPPHHEGLIGFTGSSPELRHQFHVGVSQN